MEALRQTNTQGSTIIKFPDRITPQFQPFNFQLPQIDDLIKSYYQDVAENEKGVFLNSTVTEVKGSSQMNDQDIIIKYIDILDKDRRDMEARITADKKASEERLQSAIEKIEKGQDSVKKEVRGLTITVIIGVAAMIAASVLAIAQIFAQFASLIRQ